MKREGKIVIIVAPSGSGKSTLIKKLKETIPGLIESVSYTTRKQRPGEEDGVNYHYIGREKFQEKVLAGDFIEWAEVHENFYGTEKVFVERELSEGKNLLFDLDVQGADAFKEYFSDRAKAIFISPPGPETLEKRLRKRGTDSTQTIQLRISNSKKELARQHDYDFRIVNDDFDQAFSELEKVVKRIVSGKVSGET